MKNRNVRTCIIKIIIISVIISVSQAPAQSQAKIEDSQQLCQLIWSEYSLS